MDPEARPTLSMTAMVLLIFSRLRPSCSQRYVSISSASMEPELNARPMPCIAHAAASMRK